MARTVLLALFAIACGAEQKAVVGKAAPNYHAASLTGGASSLAELKGKVVLVNAWATWCKPCLEELPELRRLHTELGSRGLAVVGVSLDEDTAEAPILKFAQDHQMAYAIWHDPAQRLMTTFDFAGLPTTVLIDRDGVLRWRSTGKLVPGDSTFDAELKRALK